MSRGFGFGRGGLRSAVAGLSAIALLAIAVGSVTAHTPSASLTCDGGLKVDLEEYEIGQAGDTNTVAVSIDGVAVAGSPFTFETTFHHSWDVPPATEAHTAVVEVKAWDDPTGSEGWAKTFELSIKACKDPTPEPTPTPTDKPTATPAPTPTPTGTPQNEKTPTPKPSGTVEPATGTPRITPPSTDSVGSSTGGTGYGFSVVLLLLGVASASVLLLPVSRRASRRR